MTPFKKAKGRSFYYDPNNLNQVIEGISSPEVKSHAIKVRDNLIKLASQEDQKDANYAIKLLLLTHSLLTSKPGKQREIYLAKYHEAAQKAQGMQSPLIKSIGLTMMCLGASMAALSLVCVFPGIGMAIGVSTLLIGFGVFNHGRTQTGLSGELQQLKDSVELRM